MVFCSVTFIFKLTSFPCAPMSSLRMNERPLIPYFVSSGSVKGPIIMCPYVVDLSPVLSVTNWSIDRQQWVMQSIFWAHILRIRALVSGLFHFCFPISFSFISPQILLQCKMVSFITVNLSLTCEFGNCVSFKFISPLILLQRKVVSFITVIQSLSCELGKCSSGMTFSHDSALSSENQPTSHWKFDGSAKLLTRYWKD